MRSLSCTCLGSVGKTTLTKQLSILQGKGFSDDEKKLFLQVARKNVINSMQILCTQSDALGIPGCEVSMANKSLKEKLTSLKVGLCAHFINGAET